MTGIETTRAQAPAPSPKGACTHPRVTTVVVVSAGEDRAYTICRGCLDSSPVLGAPLEALEAFHAGRTKKRPDGLAFERGR